MKVILGSNTVEDCDAALIVNGVEVFRLRERTGDARLVCDFDLGDQNGNRLAKVAKNNVVHAAPGYKVQNLARESSISDPAGGVVARVQEIALDTIRITGDFWVKGFHVSITDNELVSGGVTMGHNLIKGFKKAISINPGSFTIGTA